MAEAWDEGRRVDAVELMGLVGEIFRACGMDDDDAHLMADSLVYADLGGVHSHGVLRVPEYAEKLTAAGVDPRASIIVFDAAFAGSSHGKIRIYQQKGLALPPGC